MTAVKAELPHGQFLPWIAAEFEMSDRTANDFMNVANRFGGKSAIISDLKPTILYALSAPSTYEFHKFQAVSFIRSRRAFNS